MSDETRERVVDIETLREDDNNAREHDERSLQAITESVEESGPARSGVVDEHGKMIAGSGSLEAMRRAGIRRVRIVPQRPDEWVVVEVPGLDEHARARLALADNRTQEASRWKPDVLKALGTSVDGGFEGSAADGLFTFNEWSQLTLGAAVAEETAEAATEGVDESDLGNFDTPAEAVFRISCPVGSAAEVAQALARLDGAQWRRTK